MGFMICLLLVLVGVGLLVVLSQVLTKRRQGPMACGACGYPVEGLSALRCPECGADLRKVGIQPAVQRSSATSVVMALGVVGVVFLLGFGVFVWLFTAQPSTPMAPATLQSTPFTGSPSISASQPQPNVIVPGPDAPATRPRR